MYIGASAEFLATDARTFEDASNFYRCVDANEIGLPTLLDGACGGKGQHCCSSGKHATQCGAGLTCNLGVCFILSFRICAS
jgi:hypothetical protein